MLDTLNIASYNLCLHNILVVNSNIQSVPLPLLFDLPIQFDILLHRCLLDDYTNTLFDIVNDCESVYLMICDEQIVKQLLVKQGREESEREKRWALVCFHHRKTR